MNNGQTSERKPVRFTVSADGARSGANNGKTWRQQTVLAHIGEEVRSISFFLRDNEPFLEPGVYALAPDAVYVGDRPYTDRNGRARSEPGLMVAPRFVKVPNAVSVPKAA